MSEAPSTGWLGTVPQFQASRPELIADQLRDFVVFDLSLPVSRSQVHSWQHWTRALGQSLRDLQIRHDFNLEDHSVALEYCIPRERGRRVDAIVFGRGVVVIIEFKGAHRLIAEDTDQLRSYARDIVNYHLKSQDLRISSFLVLSQWNEKPIINEDIQIMSEHQFSDALYRILRTGSGDLVDAAEWCSSPYQPLPSLTAAARSVFNKEPLPRIKRAASADVPRTVERLVAIATEAAKSNTKHLALVTGVPGAGKTLAGLSLAYSEALPETDSGTRGLLLSGNGPLVDVLQHTLRSKVFVQDVHAFLKNYGQSKRKVPPERCLIFDEAQRAWDAARVQEKRPGGQSEPAEMIAIAERQKGWTLVCALVGEGQAIHLGEETGLEMWAEAVRKSPSAWTVHVPPHLSRLFDGLAPEVDRTLHLDVPMRSHVAEGHARFVEAILSADASAARTLGAAVVRNGFQLYVTRQADRAFSYVRQRYAGNEDARYGLFQSSRSKTWVAMGIEAPSSRDFHAGLWYTEKASCAFSCCQLSVAATEFTSQGLEVDFGVIGWGRDLLIRDGTWTSDNLTRGARNGHQLRINSYRVLLTRYRDGLIVYLPSDHEFDETEEYFKSSGFHSLL